MHHMHDVILVFIRCRLRYKLGRESYKEWHTYRQTDRISDKQTDPTQGGRGHWAVCYTSPQSFKTTFSYSLAQQPMLYLPKDLADRWTAKPIRISFTFKLQYRPRELSLITILANAWYYQLREITTGKKVEGCRPTYFPQKCH